MKEQSVKRLLWLPALLIPLVLMLSIGCPGSYDPPQTTDTAGGQQDGLWWPNPDAPPQKWDTGNQQQDQGYQWPDGPPPQVDSYQWPDTYSGTPFGCQTDGDCFGLKCCSTPWGVKLCTEVCE